MAIDITPGDILNGDDVAAQNVVNTGAAEAIANPPTPSFEVMGGIDSSAVEAVLHTVQETREQQKQQEANPAVLMDPAQTAPQEKQMSPYQKRVQTLIKEREEAKAFAKQQAQAMQQMQLELQKQREAQTQSILDMQRRQLEQYERKSEEQAEASLPEHERVKRQFERELLTKAKQQLAPELESYKKELEAIKLERKQAQEAAEKERRFQYFTQQGKQVLENKLLAGYDPQDSKAIAPQMEEMLYAYAAAYGMEPSQAAPYFEKFKADLFRAEAKRLQRTAGVKVAQSQNAPAPLPAGHSGASVATAMPSLDQLKRNGLDNHVQWIAKGRPKLIKP